MAFTTPCFIYKNTNELREKLYRLGGRSGSNLWDIEINTLLGADKYSFRCYDNEYGVAESLIRDNYIDCGTNEELFLAIAALRNDIDINQWFILQYGSWGKCECESMIDMWGDFDEEIGEKYPRKATVEELI